MTKVTAEAQAKQIIADVIETTLPLLRFLPAGLDCSSLAYIASSRQIFPRIRRKAPHMDWSFRRSSGSVHGRRL